MSCPYRMPVPVFHGNYAENDVNKWPMTSSGMNKPSPLGTKFRVNSRLMIMMMLQDVRPRKNATANTPIRSRDGPRPL